MKRTAILKIKGKEVKAETEGSYYCRRCGRPLTSEESQRREVGPCCGKTDKSKYYAGPMVILSIAKN